MTTVLITGATGFCGHHALAYLRRQSGIRVIAACRDASRLPGDYDGPVREGDLRDPAYLHDLFDEVDALIHAASWSSLWGHAGLSRRLYLEPTLATLHAARAAGVERIVNISTASAAAPDHPGDPQAAGIPRGYWPHLVNVVRIEDELRRMASEDLTVVNLRLGLFAGQHYGLGLLPILLPRLKTHLVPWVAGGRTGMPIIDGRDIGQALGRAALAPDIRGFESFDVVGPTIPTVREVVTHLHDTYGYPRPHFSVPFPVAFTFAWLMEQSARLLRHQPLVTRSIIHLLRDTGADNAAAGARLGYHPAFHWTSAIADQVTEMRDRQKRPMAMICAPD